MRKVIAIANHKGGVGKTTSVSSLGVALSKLGKRVLLVDLDAQCNLTDLFLKDYSGESIYQALRGDISLPIIQVQERLYLTPSSLDLVAMDIELSTKERREYRLKELLQGVEVDYILIDCPPSLGLLTINSLVACDEVYIPLTAEASPAKGLGTLLKIIEGVRANLNEEIKLGGVIITRYNRRKINRLVEESLREEFGDKVFKNKIRENVDITESPLFSKDVFSYSPDSNGVKDYTALAKEILELETISNIK